MNTYVFGFIAGLVLTPIMFFALLFNPMLIKHYGPCAELSKQETEDLIMESASKPDMFAMYEKEYDGVELVEDHGYEVFTTLKGKRVGRHFPMVNCGYLEWGSDPNFKPEQ
jgi:hypothetical protein